MTNKIKESDLFNSQKVSHGFLTRHFGNAQMQGIKDLEVCRLKQVHSNKVIQVQSKDDLESHASMKADAMVTSLSKIALTIVTADCVPLLLYDSLKKVIGAAHGGWRGTSKNISAVTIQSFVDLYDSNPADLKAAIGPCIQKCCYEVDAPVYEAFDDKRFFSVIPAKAGISNHWMIDLKAITQHQLIKSGVLKQNIWISPDCTACQTEHFFSYRKEGQQAGRQWSFIALN